MGNETRQTIETVLNGAEEIDSRRIRAALLVVADSIDRVHGDVRALRKTMATIALSVGAPLISGVAFAVIQLI